jgi:trehalose-6-phosphate synthase
MSTSVTEPPPRAETAAEVRSAIQEAKKALSTLRAERDAPDPSTPTPRRALVVVSNRLPLTASRDADNKLTFKASSGGLVSALSSVRTDADAGAASSPFIWVGWLGKEVREDEQAVVRELLLREHRCVPVFMTDKLAERFYSDMSNDTLASECDLNTAPSSP